MHFKLMETFETFFCCNLHEMMKLTQNKEKVLIVSKLLEKVAANQIMKYLNKFKLLNEHQYTASEPSTTLLNP